MALFFPDIHSKNLKLTAGERRFATCLLRNLEDDYCCWINVPVGSKQLRPDFIVLHPGRGILTLGQDAPEADFGRSHKAQPKPPSE